MEAEQHAAENQQITEEIKKIKNKNMHRNEWKWKHKTQNLWDTVEALLKGRFIAIQAYLKKQEKKSNK